MTTYIALTALESHWGNPENTRLLTEACRLYDGGNAWEHYPPPVEQAPFADINVFESAYARCTSLAHQLFPLLAERLEQHFHLGFSLRFYERILYPWILEFTQSLFCHYSSIRCATKLADDVCFLTAPTDTAIFPVKDGQRWDVAVGSCDRTNLLMYSDVVVFLGLRQKTIQIAPLPADIPTWGALPQGQQRPLERALLADAGLTGRPVHFSFGCYGVPDIKTLLRKGHTRLIPARNYLQLPLIKPDTNFRNTPVALPSSANDEFSQLLGAFAPRYLPFGMCECLPQLVCWARAQPLPTKGVLGTSHGLYTDTPLMVLAGVKQRPLAIVEHGWNYLHEDYHSVSQPIVADRYYSWGKATPFFLPTPYISEMAPARKCGAPLFITRDIFPYPARLALFFSQGSTSHYHDQRVAFLKNIPPQYLPHMRFPPRIWIRGDRERLRKKFPTLNFQNPSSVPITQATADACLVILDHCVTTFCRTLATNRPTIAFLSPGYFQHFSSEAQGAFNQLRTAGIFHNTAESAAQFYTTLIPTNISSWADAAPTINEWWLSRETQKAREYFCDTYVHASENWTDEWIQAFDALAEEGAREKAFCEL